MAPSYHDHWEPVHNRGLHEFRDRYWGARGRLALKKVLARPPLERFLRVRETAVQNLFHMHLPKGLFFVREDHRFLADRLRKARDDKTASHMRGCLLLGQQGVGKTYFLLFLLMQCLSHEETVLFTSSLGDTYLFDQDGIVRTRMSDFSPCTHVPDDVPDPSQRLWSLVDCPVAKEPISPSVTCDTRQLFFVAATRPDVSLYGALREQCNVREWWMADWTEDELRTLLASLPAGHFPLSQQRQYPLSAPDTVRSLIHDVGRCPQDILLYLTAPSKYESLVNTALLQYTTVDALYCLLSGLDPSTNEDSHKLVHLSRATPATQDVTDADDRVTAHFKTRVIRDRVFANLRALSADGTAQLYATFRASGGGGGGPLQGDTGLFTAAFSDVLFENLAIHHVQYELDEWRPLLPSPHWQPFTSMHEQPPTLLPSACESSSTRTRTRTMTRAQAAAAVRFLYYSPSWNAPAPTDPRRTTVVLDDSAAAAAGGHAACTWRPSRGAEERPPRWWYGECRMWASQDPWFPLRAREETCASVAAFCAAFDEGDGDGGVLGLRPWVWAAGAPFDVYCVEVDYDDATIWAVRVATPRRDGGRTETASAGGEGGGGRGGGFAEIARMKEGLGLREERQIDVNYVVVVPFEEPGFAVEWSLPEAGFEEFPGAVFVQFVDVRMFGGNVAQVLGVPRPDDDMPASGTSGTVKRGAKRRRAEVEEE